MKIIDEKDMGTVKLLTHEGNFATILLNRPDVLNAMNPALIDDLAAACRAVSDNPSLRAMVLRGEGRAFSAGGDVNEDIIPLQSMDPVDYNKYMMGALIMYKTIYEMPIPTVAAVNGLAVGGGFDMILCCDFRIAADDARFGEFFVRMGLAPEVGSYLLPRLVGSGWAKRLSCTGDLIDCATAKAIGLVEEVVAPGKLVETAEAFAHRLANGPKAVAEIKKAINAAYDMSIDGAIDHTLRLQYQLTQTADHREAVDAFVNKRKPVFQGR